MDAAIDVGEKRLREDLERLERFRLLDDTFMRQVFRGQLGLAQHVLRILTGLDGLTLVKEETQHDLKRATGSKSPVLDVWGTDGSGTQYDMEVQAGSGLDPLRFRYYGSAMDVDAEACQDSGQRFIRFLRQPMTAPARMTWPPRSARRTLPWPRRARGRRWPRADGSGCSTTR